MQDIELQVAFQGGGARLCDLLAALEGIRTLEDDGRLRVSRVAGSSAGAIAACLYATGEHPSVFRKHLLDKGQEYVEEVSKLSRGFGSLVKIARGKPLLDPNLLRRLLISLFQSSSSGKWITFRDLRLPVVVTTTDLLNGEMVPVCNPDAKIVDVLADSAGLPFVFRTVKNAGENPRIDGGICENLPSDVLLKDQEEHGPVVGVSFEPNSQPYKASTVIQFAWSLLDAAIGNSVTRSTRALGIENVLALRTNIGTADVEEAFRSGLSDDHYSNVKSQSEKWFANFVDRENRLRKQRLTEEEKAAKSPGPFALQLMKDMARVYEGQHATAPVSVSKLAMVVTANSLLPPSAGRLKPDEVLQYTHLIPEDRPVHFIRESLGGEADSGFGPKSSWNIKDGKGNRRDLAIFPLRHASKKREVVIFFLPPLCSDGEETAPFVLTQQDEISNAMRPLHDSGQDFICVQGVNYALIERVDLVLFIPSGFGPVQMYHLDDPDEKMLESIPGSKLSEKELDAYGVPPLGFTAIGWKGENLKRGQSFGVKLVASPKNA